MATNLRLGRGAEEAVRREAQRTGRSQQDVIREAVHHHLGLSAGPGASNELDEMVTAGVVRRRPGPALSQVRKAHHPAFRDHHRRRARSRGSTWWWPLRLVRRQQCADQAVHRRARSPKRWRQRSMSTFGQDRLLGVIGTRLGGDQPCSPPPCFMATVQTWRSPRRSP